MIPQFILEYAGQPVRFGSGGMELTDELHADKFLLEAEAWMTACANDLNPANCRVRNLNAESL